MVATRRRGEIPAREDSVSQKNDESVTPRTRKRKAVEITNTNSVETDDDDEPPEVASSAVKRKRTGKSSETPAKKLEIRTKASRPVVEIPFMDPIPPSELSTPIRETSNAVVQINEPENEEDEVVEVDTAELPAPVSVEQPLSPPVAPNTLENSVPDTPKPEAQATPSKSPSLVPELNIAPLGLSDLLPEELLQDDEDDEEQEVLRNGLDLIRPQIKAKKTTFEDGGHISKDRTIGSTTYKVERPRNLALAPVSLTQARKTKEAWLQGRAGSKIGTNRKPFSKGFFDPKK